MRCVTELVVVVVVVAAAAAAVARIVELQNEI
jgi:hypothetical protein